MSENEEHRIYLTVKYFDGQSTSDIADNKGASRTWMMRRLAKLFIDPNVVSLSVAVRP